MERIPSGPLAGRTVLVTGSSGGIGRATALGLATMRAYSQSKLANILFTYELARRLGAGGVTANALHPGMVRTGFGAEDSGSLQRLFTPLMRPFMRTPAQGAATSIYLASSPEVAGVTGCYFAGCKRKGSSKRSCDEATAARLWQVSADLVGLTAVR